MRSPHRVAAVVPRADGAADIWRVFQGRAPRADKDARSTQGLRTAQGQLCSDCRRPTGRCDRQVPLHCRHQRAGVVPTLCEASFWHPFVFDLKRVPYPPLRRRSIAGIVCRPNPTVAPDGTLRPGRSD